MTTNLTPANRSTLIWDESSVLETGIKFLKQKNLELNIFKKLNETEKLLNQHKGFFTEDTYKKKYKHVLSSQINEIKKLQTNTVNIIEDNLKIGTYPERIERLNKINDICQSALLYLDNVNRYEERQNMGISGTILVTEIIILPLTYYITNDPYVLTITACATAIMSSLIYIYEDPILNESINKSLLVYNKVLSDR